MRKWLALLIILLPMVSTAGEPLDKVVAIVNDGVITASELNAQVDSFRKQLLAKKVELPAEAELRKQVLQHLIDVDLQLQLAKQNDISVDNTDLNEAIAKIAAANNLSLTQLREELTKQGLTWQAYRENIRKELLISRLQQKAVSKELIVSPQQVEDYLKTAQRNVSAQQTYRLQNIVISLPEEPTPEQLVKAEQKAQELLAKIKQGEEFNRLAISQSNGEFALEGGDLGDRHLAELPELFAKHVVQMKIGEVVGPLRAGNGYQLIKLLAIGGDNQSHQIVKTHVRHILLKQDASMTTAEAIKQANNLYQQLKAGKNFAAMAKRYSLDTMSANKGGDLGWVSPGELVPEFEKAMDALPPHQVSKPVKSLFGWHLIEVLERKEVDDSDSYKRQQIRQYLQQRKFTEAVQNWQQHLRSKAYVNIIEKDLA